MGARSTSELASVICRTRYNFVYTRLHSKAILCLISDGWERLAEDQILLFVNDGERTDQGHSLSSSALAKYNYV